MKAIMHDHGTDISVRMTQNEYVILHSIIAWIVKNPRKRLDKLKVLRPNEQQALIRFFEAELEVERDATYDSR